MPHFRRSLGRLAALPTSARSRTTTSGAWRSPRAGTPRKSAHSNHRLHAPRLQPAVLPQREENRFHVRPLGNVAGVCRRQRWLQRSADHFLTDARCNSVRWSRDGLRLTFAAISGANRDIYVADADGGATHRLTTDSSEEGRPSWSRDGRWIYFVSNRTSRQEVWKMPAKGGGAVQVTKGGGHESFESPDGKVLY